MCASITETVKYTLLAVSSRWSGLISLLAIAWRTAASVTGLASISGLSSVVLLLTMLLSVLWLGTVLLSTTATATTIPSWCRRAISRLVITAASVLS